MYSILAICFVCLAGIQVAWQLDEVNSYFFQGECPYTGKTPMVIENAVEVLLYQAF